MNSNSFQHVFSYHINLQLCSFSNFTGNLFQFLCLTKAYSYLGSKIIKYYGKEYTEIHLHQHILMRVTRCHHQIALTTKIWLYGLIFMIFIKMMNEILIVFIMKLNYFKPPALRRFGVPAAQREQGCKRLLLMMLAMGARLGRRRPRRRPPTPLFVRP